MHGDRVLVDIAAVERMVGLRPDCRTGGAGASDGDGRFLITAAEIIR